MFLKYPEIVLKVSYFSPGLKLVYKKEKMTNNCNIKIIIQSVRMIL
jgi:hypothetical protein